MQIIALDKKRYKGFTLEFRYTTEYYYHIVIDSNEIFSIKLIKKPYGKELHKGFTAELYRDYFENASAFSINNNGQVLGYLEVDRELWNNRLRITELLVLDEFRDKGYGSSLINKAKDIAKSEGFREVILETQSCNSKAIEFYIKNGFKINGIDLSCYSNNDVDKKEVRLEMIYRLENGGI